MGGAFIAVADDATAASWNPGGLTQLEKPEISAVGQFFHRTEDNDFGTNPEASGDQSVTEANLNYLSGAYPFTLFNRNMIVSLNYQYLFDFSREWNFPLVQSSGGLSLSQNVDFDQDGNLSALGIAYAIQVTPKLSFGFTLNIWEDWLGANEWDQTTRQKGSGTLLNNPFIFESESHDRFTFNGFNANLGILWNVIPKLTLGAVLKTPFTADVERESTFFSSISFPESPGANSTISSARSEDLELDMPMVYGIGFAYRFSDHLTVSADFTRTEWDDFILRDSQGRETSPISGLSNDESDIDPTHQVRIGAEYLFIQPKYVIPVRCGFFYDPAPAEGNPDDFFGISLGSGYGRGRFIFDVAYQYRFGRDVGGSILQNLDFSQDIDEHSVYLSAIIHF
jgi:long-subunit fatty acid transport protein